MRHYAIIAYHVPRFEMYVGRNAMYQSREKSSLTRLCTELYEYVLLKRSAGIVPSDYMISPIEPSSRGPSN